MQSKMVLRRLNTRWPVHKYLRDYPFECTVRQELFSRSHIFRPSLSEIKLHWDFSLAAVSKVVLSCAYQFTRQMRTVFDTDDRHSFKHSSILPALAAAISASIIWKILTSDKETIDSNISSSTCHGIAQLLSEMFTAHAAKPLTVIPDDIDPNKVDHNISAKLLGRRDQFNFIADVVQDVQNSVVSIEVKDHSAAHSFGANQSGNGSGFIVKDDGLILTNAHVVAVQQRNSILVKLQDGRCFTGYIEDVDYESDLATVRIKGKNLPTLKLGCSSETRMGEWVVALGSPLNLSNTVTAGVVSSTRRDANELGIQANDIGYIQTDAAITFGNSGGPLVNLDGEAIGINSMKITTGISFAIPIDHAKMFLARGEKRRASGKTRASRPYVGLTILTLTDPIRAEIEARIGISCVSRGVFVWQVTVSSPAQVAGLKPGDIITNINGIQVTSALQVHDAVKTFDKLEMEVQRGGGYYKFTVVPEQVIMQ